MTTTSSERRLHPLSIILDAARTLPQLLLPLAVLLFTARSTSLYLWLMGFTALALIAPVVRYFRFTYSYDERELVVRSGLFTRNERRIPYVRIQNLDASQSLVQRLFGVTLVFVQTGGGALPEATLRVLPVAALDEMRARVLAAGGRAGAVASHTTADEPANTPDDVAIEPASTTLLSIPPRELLLAGFIENRGMVLIIGAIALLDRANVTERLISRMFDTQAGTLWELASHWVGGSVPVVRAALYLIGALLVHRTVSDAARQTCRHGPRARGYRRYGRRRGRGIPCRRHRGNATMSARNSIRRSHVMKLTFDQERVANLVRRGREMDPTLRCALAPGRERQS